MSTHISITMTIKSHGIVTSRNQSHHGILIHIMEYVPQLLMLACAPAHYCVTSVWHAYITVAMPLTLTYSVATFDLDTNNENNWTEQRIRLDNNETQKDERGKIMHHNSST